MRTYTLQNGETRPIADLSLRRSIELMKQDFRTMAFTLAWELNRDEIDYIIRNGWMKRCNIIRTMRMTSEFAGNYNL